MDVKTAFLYGKIDAEVYVELPPNLESKYPANSVCKLNKALYGLKQAPKICIFVHGKERLVIGVHVDDLLIMGENREAIDRLKIKLQTRFKMTDLGPATYYLGIKLTRQWNQWGNKLCLSQKAYIKKILKDFKMEDANGVATPIADVSLAPHEDINYSADPELRKWYQSAVGSLMYLMLSTRPDIAYAVITIEDPPAALCLCFLARLLHGAPNAKQLSLFQAVKQSILQKLRLLRKQSGCVDSCNTSII
jgi:Reverse transcriptase (RNA-dependent DNA polymerase)